MLNGSVCTLARSYPFIYSRVFQLLPGVQHHLEINEISQRLSEYFSFQAVGGETSNISRLWGKKDA